MKAVPFAYIEAILAAMLMSTVPVVIRGIEADAWVIGMFRLVFSTLIVGTVALRAKKFIQLNRKQWGGLIFIGISFGLHWMGFFWSIKLASAQMGMISVSTYGIWVMILGALFLGHRMTRFHLVGLSMAIAGTVLTGGSIDFNALGPYALCGFISGVASAFFYAILPIFHQRMTAVPMSQRTLAQYGWAILIFLPTAPLGDWNFSAGSILGLIYLTIFGTVISHTLWIKATSALPTTVSGILYYFYVPTGCVVSYLTLGEKLTTGQIVGAVLIVVGSIVGIVGPNFRKSTGRPDPQ